MCALCLVELNGLFSSSLFRERSHLFLSVKLYPVRGFVCIFRYPLFESEFIRLID